MTLIVETVACLTDNYAYIVTDEASGECAVVDVPEAGPIIAALTRLNRKPSQIWLTHHHYDHIDGLPELRETFPAKVIGAKADAHRLPPLDVALAEGDSFSLGTETINVIDVSGHTVGHIAFLAPASGYAFTGDSLMALGCGRIFEGTPEMMWNSLSKFRALPRDTVICSGHEYTAANARFALSVEPGNAALQERAAHVDAARAAGRPTVPSILGDELDTNPFLRPESPELKQSAGETATKDWEVFAAIRAMKDRF